MACWTNLVRQPAGFNEILLNNGGPRQLDLVIQHLAAGADPGIRGPQGRTALENAERLGLTQIAEIIRVESGPAP